VTEELTTNMRKNYSKSRHLVSATGKEFFPHQGL